MRRLPIYFLIDVSESMVGDPVEQVQQGIKDIVQELRTDPYALETVFISVIAFAGRPHLLSPLEELYKFYPPELPIGDGTAIGSALNFLMDDLDRSIKKNTMEVKGDWKPIIFFFTDGVPTDNPSKSVDRWVKKYKKSCNPVAVSLGDGADTNLLGNLSDNVLRLNETSKDSFRAFFKWVTASIKVSSISVTDYGKDEMHLPSVDGINLEKVDTSKKYKIDENFVVLLGKCSKKQMLYLIKFGKQDPQLSRSDSTVFSLIGAYPVNEDVYKKFSGDSFGNEKITTDRLAGAPSCPCCGNPLSMVVCGRCGKLFCFDPKEYMCTCSWCGNTGQFKFTENPLNLERERG